tara:strand:+ start:5506 stop:6102 length:597 start_codon:yes stop_codon:yes gene_type:complete
MKNKMLTKQNMFGGYRLLGYLNDKPLVAQFRLDKEGFDIKFNQDVLDNEYAGKFNSKLLDGNLEMYLGRLSAPFGTLPKNMKGSETRPSTIAWIATLIEINEMKSRISMNKGKITKEYLHLVAGSIFVSDDAYVENKEQATSYLDAGKYFKLHTNDPVSNNFLDAMMHQHTFPQFLKQLKEKKNISYTARSKISKVAA